MRFSVVASFGVLLTMFGCRGCVEQHDPRSHWSKFEAESQQANRLQPVLSEDGQMPSAVPVVDAGPVDPIADKYATFCANCHGAKGGGDGPAGLSLNPKARNFITWNDPKITDEYIAKIIREGGTAVGKSASMAAWGGVLSEDEIKGMVALVRGFKKP